MSFFWRYLSQTTPNAPLLSAFRRHTEFQKKLEWLDFRELEKFILNKSSFSALSTEELLCSWLITYMILCGM